MVVNTRILKNMVPREFYELVAATEVIKISMLERKIVQPKTKSLFCLKILIKVLELIGQQ